MRNEGSVRRENLLQRLFGQPMNKFIGNCESRPDTKGQDCENISPDFDRDGSNYSLGIYSRAGVNVSR